MDFNFTTFPPRPAWTEIDLGRLRRTLQLISRDLPAIVKLLAVVKDEAYGHGALDVARIALEEGASFLGLSTLEEAIANIKEAIELYLETLPIDDRDLLLSREILTTAVEVDA